MPAFIPQPDTGKLLVVDYQNPKVFAVDPKTGATSVFMTVTGEHPGLDGLWVDLRCRWQRVRDRRAPGNNLESRQRGRRGNGLGHEPASQANEAAPPPSAQTVWRSTRSTQRCSSPTPRKTLLLKYR
jgi:hypothetical protein